MLKFILQLSQDFGLQCAFAEDSEKVMREHGLSEAEKAALRSGDEAQVRQLAGIGDDATVAKIIWVFDPEPAQSSALQVPEAA